MRVQTILYVIAAVFLVACRDVKTESDGTLLQDPTVAFAQDESVTEKKRTELPLQEPKFIDDTSAPAFKLKVCNSRYGPARGGLSIDCESQQKALCQFFADDLKRNGDTFHFKKNEIGYSKFHAMTSQMDRAQIQDITWRFVTEFQKAELVEYILSEFWIDDVKKSLGLHHAEGRGLSKLVGKNLDGIRIQSALLTIAEDEVFFGEDVEGTDITLFRFKRINKANPSNYDPLRWLYFVDPSIVDKNVSHGSKSARLDGYMMLYKNQLIAHKKNRVTFGFYKTDYLALGGLVQDGQCYLDWEKI